MIQEGSTQAELARMYQLWDRSRITLPDLLVEVEELCLDLSKQVDTSLRIIDSLQDWAQSLREQV